MLEEKGIRHEKDVKYFDVKSWYEKTLTNVIRLQITMQHHDIRDRSPMEVRQSLGQTLCAFQDVHVRHLPLRPEPSPPVADAIVVSEQLRQRATVQPFHDHESHSPWSEAGADELDDVGMVQPRMHLQLRLDFVYRERDVLAFRLERLHHYRLSVQHCGMNPSKAVRLN